MVEYETEAPGRPLGPGPSTLKGPPFSFPFGPTSVDVPLVTRDVMLAGYSIRESTGLAGAVVELYDGGNASGTLLASITLNASSSPLAGKTPASSTLSGGNAQQAPSIGGVAGTTAVVKQALILGLGATAATEVQATLAGVLGGTITLPVAVPAGATVPITPVQALFGDEGLPASGAGQAITLTLPAFGAGNTFEQASVIGYIQAVAGNAQTQWFGDPGLWVRSGLFLHLVAGSVKGTIWIAS